MAEVPTTNQYRRPTHPRLQPISTIQPLKKKNGVWCHNGHRRVPVIYVKTTDKGYEPTDAMGVTLRMDHAVVAGSLLVDFAWTIIGLSFGWARRDYSKYTWNPSLTIYLSIGDPGTCVPKGLGAPHQPNGARDLDLTPIANWNLTPRALSSVATLSVVFCPRK